MFFYKKHRYYINLLMLLRVIGYLLVIESLFMLVPCIIAMIFKEKSLFDFLICAGITGACGAGMMMLRPKSKDMGKREAILLTGMTWVILSLFGMLPFLFTGTHFTITDAFFETMSGFTTTGASVLNSLEEVPKSILAWRCVVQWIGGLGIILFTLAVVPMLNYSGGMQLFNAEVTGITHDKLRPRVSFTAKGLWAVYILLTVLLIIFLSFSKMDFFDAFCHGLSTMSTGGFSTSDMNISQWNSLYIKTVMCVFMFLGGVNFSLLFNTLTGKGGNPFKNTAFKCYVWVVIICYLGFVINILIQGLGTSWEYLTIDPLFQTISILSSTGITEPNFKDWGSISIVLLLVMILMGSCAGSTSGGAKIDRFVVLFKFIKNEFYKMMHPSTVTTVIINGKGTTVAVVHKTLAFLFLYAIVICAGGLALSLMGLPLSDAFFCASSAISNTGLGTEVTGLSENYALIPDAAKWLLSIIMLIGRLEIFTILLLFTPTFWRK